MDYAFDAYFEGTDMSYDLAVTYGKRPADFVKAWKAECKKMGVKIGFAPWVQAARP